MQSRAVNGFTAAEVDAAFKGKNRPQKYRVRAELYDKNRNFIRDLDNLIKEGSEVGWVWDAEIQGTGRVRIREADIELDDYATLVVNDAPLFYWRFGESSGTTVEDASGNGRTGTYNGSPTLQAQSLLDGAQENTAVTFDGTNDYAAIPDGAWMDITTAGTWEAWIKTTASGSLKYIMSRDDTVNGSSFHYRLTSTGTLQLVLFSALNTAFAFPEGPVVNDGLPHHVVATYDGSYIRYYIDGIETTKSAASGTIANTNRPIEVGRHETGGTAYFNGTIDEVAFYNRALSAQEVRNHYQKGADDLREFFMTDRIKIFVALEMDSNGTDGTPYAEWAVGEYLMQNPTRIETEGGVVLETDIFDQNALLVNYRFANRYTVASGTNYITAITTVLTTVGFVASQLQLTATSSTLPAAREWEAGTSALQIINDLLQAINYQFSGEQARLRFDGDGYARAEPYALPHTRADEYTYQTDQHSVILLGVRQELKLIRVFNKVIANRSDPSATTITSTSTNNNVESNASVPVTGQTITRVIESPAADQTTLDNLSKRILTEGTEVEKITFQTPLAPWHANADKIRFIHSYDGPGSMTIDDSWIETEWRLSLEESGDMEHKCKQSVRVT